MKPTVSLSVKYYNKDGSVSHEYQESWARDEVFFCPSCGLKELWKNQGAGDYYSGSESLCLACGDSHYLSQCGCPTDGNVQAEQRFAAIRSFKDE